MAAPKSQAYLRAFEEAVKEFAQHDPEVMAAASKTTFCPDSHCLLVPLMGTVYALHHPSGETRIQESASESVADLSVRISTKVLLLHYVTQASGLPLQDHLISFKEIPGGSVYFDAFRRRAIDPLVKAFGTKPQALMDAGVKLGAVTKELGDGAVEFSVFPAIPVTYVVWQGEDVPGRGNVLFDASVRTYLPMEDLAVLASLPVYAMLKQLH